MNAITGPLCLDPDGIMSGESPPITRCTECGSEEVEYITRPIPSRSYFTIFNEGKLVEHGDCEGGESHQERVLSVTCYDCGASLYED